MSSQSDVLLAGAFSAFTVDFLIYPLDTIKTRLQTTTLNTRIPLKGLYQGITPIVVATIPSSCVFFTVYETCRSIFPQHPLSSIPSSSIAELASCFVLTPFEVIKQRAQKTVGASTLQTFRAAVKSTGAFGLWNGYSSLVMRNLPFTAVQFSVFEALKRRWGVGAEFEKGDLRKGAGGTLVWAGYAAGCAGVCGAVVTTPLDAVKTRIMVGDKGGFWLIWKRLGWRGLARGGFVRAVWTALGSGLYLGVYEGTKVALRERREGKGSLGVGEVA